MDIKILAEGLFATNCYVCSSHQKALVIDPNHQAESIVELLDGLELEAILLTHGHIDHISALNELKTFYPKVPVYLHHQEVIYLTDTTYNLSTSIFGEPYVYKGDFELLEDGQETVFLGESVKIFHLPGHSLGSLGYYFQNKNLIFSGDVLFYHSIGRTDLKGCNTQDLFDSIKNRLYTLPRVTEVYPGHGIKTTIQHEMENNLFTK